jgi:glutamine amidotransferase
MITIIDYGAGNVRSVLNALQRMNVQATISDNPEIISKAEKVIFPGVGHAKSAMTLLKNKGLDETIVQLKQPFLGICLGMQLMCNYSEEGDTQCLGIFDTEVKLFDESYKLAIPHIGWNAVQLKENKLFAGIASNSDFYFVHSYYVPLNDFTIGETNYSINFSASIHKDNFYATQFHPEKSGLIGQQVLKNFIEL